VPSIRTFVVDAFARRPFGGNPAAVCLVEDDLDDERSLAIAAEMKHSVTAFVRPGRAPNGFGLRWFTPKVELDLCGHGTFSAAAVLFGERGVNAEAIRFATRSGELVATAEGGRFRVDLPKNDSGPVEPPRELLTALGIKEPAAVHHAPRTRKLVVEVASRAHVRRLTPDFQALAAARNELDVRGVVATSPGDEGFDFVSRYFAPWVGIDEDPATGATHTILGPYWARKMGKSTFRARQDSARGGEMDVRVLGDRVHLVGDALVVLRGSLAI
jgi:PhzF family phenazine biosynthesis protein